jgi:hypothetical protein
MVTLESTIEKEFASVLAAINRGSSKDVLEKENKTEATIHMQECLDRALAELESVNC